MAGIILVTRKRITKNTTEESIIDFVLLSEDLIENLAEIKIDDEREHVLTKIVRTKKEISKVESDHNTIFSKFRLKWNKKIIQKRQELYNLKNKECQDLFKEATKSENNNRFLSSVFDEKGDINNLTKKFLKRLEKTIKQCFRKIRIKAKDDKKRDELFSKWKSLKKYKENVNKEEFQQIEKEIYEKYSEEIYQKIKMSTENIANDDDAITSKRLWNLKKQIFPKGRDPPTAMKDPVSGNLLTSNENILEAAINVYKNRLKNKPIKDNMKHIK